MREEERLEVEGKIKHLKALFKDFLDTMLKLIYRKLFLV